MNLAKLDYGVESLMPKGVEHPKIFRRPNHWRIRVESLMPKGVEHGILLFIIGKKISVESLMPKGVEHADLGAWLLMIHQVSNL